MLPVSGFVLPPSTPKPAIYERMRSGILVDGVKSLDTFVHVLQDLAISFVVSTRLHGSDRLEGYERIIG